MSSAVEFAKKGLVVVTGASQGIGRTIAIEVGQRLGNDSKIILIARSEKGLTNTKDQITQRNKNVVVAIHSVDLSDVSNEKFESIFVDSHKGDEKYDFTLIFHNAGQVGALKVTTELNDLDLWRDYYNLNMFSVALLNSVFLKKSKTLTNNIFVVNISSLCGHKPFVNMALYGSAKAARDLFFSVLAVEESNVNVLKYCPGPVDTAMFDEVISNAQNEELRSQFTEMKRSTVLTTGQTVEKLLTVLESGRYKSGDLIDYYEI